FSLKISSSKPLPTTLPIPLAKSPSELNHSNSLHSSVLFVYVLPFSYQVSLRHESSVHYRTMSLSQLLRQPGNEGYVPSNAVHHASQLPYPNVDLHKSRRPYPTSPFEHRQSNRKPCHILSHPPQSPNVCHYQ